MNVNSVPPSAAIIAHLEPEDENIEPLLQAVDLLSDICSMEVDDTTRKAAAIWSLMETIDGFPVSTRERGSCT